MTTIKMTTAAVLLALPLLSNAGMIDDTKAQIRQEREAKAIASLGNDYIQEIKKYKANPDRSGPKCYLAASENWSMWSGLPKAAFEACDEVVRQEIKGIREADLNAIATAKAERAERRKGMTEVAAKLDEMDERQQDRERELDRRDAARQAEADADARQRAKTEAIDADLAKAKRFSCTMGNKRDC
jgi:hypothetical protein